MRVSSVCSWAAASMLGRWLSWTLSDSWRAIWNATSVEATTSTKAAIAAMYPRPMREANRAISPSSPSPASRRPILGAVAQVP
ncbi:hypothetical protein D3C72_969870 [compost metagenome]